MVDWECILEALQSLASHHMDLLDYSVLHSMKVSILVNGIQGRKILYKRGL